MFLYGPPVPPDRFIGRRRELRRVASRIANHGQSAAVIGEPRTGKTSILAYFASPAGRTLVESDGSAHFLFVYLDAHALPPTVDHAYFWARVLAPLAPFVDPTILAACRDTAFDPRVIEEQLFEHMRRANLRLVVLIDELDDLVRRRVTDPAAFFGALRSLGSRAAGALAIVAASRLPLKELENEAQRRGYTGSPPFNFMTSEVLGPLSEDDVDILLDRGRARFSAEDRRYVREVAGGHPYLVQAAAGVLWDAYEDDHPGPRERRAAAGTALRDCSADILREVWEQWPVALRLVFAAVAVEHLDALSGAVGLGRRRDPDAPGPLADTEAFAEEVGLLERQGFLSEDRITPSKRRIQPVAFLAWCARELRKHASSPEHWERWLRAQGWEGYLSPEQFRTWTERVRPGLRRVPMDLDFFTGTTPARPRPRPPSTPPSVAAPAAPPRVPVRLYLSYAGSSRDEDLLAELQDHIKTLEREGRVSTWSARDVAAGAERLVEIDQNLRAADVVLLCVSADYVASDHCYGVELALALQRWRLGEAQVIPVILRAADWEGLPFGGLEPLPRGGKPISSWTRRDDAWLDVVQGIRRVVERIGGRERAGAEGDPAASRRA